MVDFARTNAIVTGGSSGVGRSVARLLWAVVGSMAERRRGSIVGVSSGAGS
jgi:NAD(P)-dependent dehydrogenase (short-subunit alcohol dehydrogenase family)